MKKCLTKSGTTKSPVLFLKPSKGLFFYFYLLILLTVLSLGFIAVANPLLLLFLPAIFYYLYLFFKKHIQLCHSRSVVALYYKQSQHWLVQYKDDTRILTEQAAGIYKCPWFAIFSLRVITSRKLFFVFVPKDSVALELYQLILYIS